jgi:hypothetical protein
MSRHSPGTLIFVIAAFAGTAQAQSVRVIDGDTIVLDRIHYRLWGIDAPEIVRYSRDYVDEEGAANAAYLGDLRPSLRAGMGVAGQQALIGDIRTFLSVYAEGSCALYSEHHRAVT